MPKRSPRRAMETSSAVSIWRRFASSGPHNAARRALSTGSNDSSSVGFLRRAFTVGILLQKEKPAGWTRRALSWLQAARSGGGALHRRLDRFLERVEALGDVGTRLLRE